MRIGAVLTAIVMFQADRFGRRRVALWSFVDLGYLTYQASYALATGAIKGEVGEEFTAGRMGAFKIEEDPGRPGAKRILMGPFTVYTKDNVEAILGSNDTVVLDCWASWCGP